MAFSIYRHPWLYGLLMRAGYHGSYAERYEGIGNHVPSCADVTEVCCGDLILHDYLQNQGKLKSYVGLDYSKAFVNRGRKRKVDTRQWDVLSDESLPPSDIVIIQASFYQFHESAEAVISRLWQAARQRLILAEPTEATLTQSPNSLVRQLAAILSRSEQSEHTFRFDEQTLLTVYEKAGIPVSHTEFIKDRREMIVVLEKASNPDA